MTSEDILLFATSGHREEYLRDFLHALGAPCGTTTHFSYKKKWIESDTLSALAENSGLMSALVVYAERDASGRVSGGSITPVRWVSVSGYAPIPLSGIDQDDHVVFALELGEYFAPSSKDWDGILKSWSDELLAGPMDPAAADQNLVVTFRTDAMKPSGVADDRWARMARHLREQYPSLARAQMFRIVSFTQTTTRTDVSMLNTSDTAWGPRYKCDTGKQYQIEIQHDGPNREGADVALEVMTPAAWLTASPPVSQGYGSSSRGLVFLASTSARFAITAVTIAPRTQREASPSHQIALVVQSEPSQARRIVVSIAVGVSLVIAGLLSASGLGFGDVVTYLLIASSALVAGVASFFGLKEPFE